MSDRRTFLSTIAAAGGSLALPRRPPRLLSAPRVEARATIFYAQPDGARNLIRFTIGGLDAPAGRLRVYDGSRRLLGTAGVLRRSEGLYGELWLPLTRTTTIISELEAPGLRGPWRSTHQVAPRRKWSLYVLSIMDHHDLTARLERLPFLRQAVAASMYTRFGISINPLDGSAAHRPIEHVPFFRLARRSLAAERQFAVPMSPIAILDDTVPLTSSLALALAGNGVRVVVTGWHEGAILQQYAVPDGSRLLGLAVPAGGTTELLGFTRSPAHMARRIERWLETSLPLEEPTLDPDFVSVLHTDPASSVRAVRAAVAEWNGRFAYPRIIAANETELIERAEAHRERLNVAPPPGKPTRETLSLAVLDDRAARRQREIAARSNNLVNVMGRLIDPEVPTLSTIASNVAALVPGTLVFNPSPYPRSELTAMEDGTERLASHVPGFGYAYFVDAAEGESATRWQDVGTSYEITGERFRLTLDTRSGAVRSLVDRVTGWDWVRSHSSGLNAVDATQLEHVRHYQLPRVANRLAIRRWSPGRGTITTKLTLYDALPWLDIENDVDPAPGRPMAYRFALSNGDDEEPLVAWETQGGFYEKNAPVEQLEHVRWIRVGRGQDGFLLRALDAPLATVGVDGTLTSHAGGGRSRYRVRSHHAVDRPDDPWVFGWHAEPFMTERVRPDGGGRLPRYGSILHIEQAGVALLGVVPGENSREVLVYLQEIQGVTRDIALGPGLIRFAEARLVDFAGRTLGVPLPMSNSTVMVPIQGGGVTAVRLSGLALQLS